MKFCRYCGNEIAQQDKYCGMCGAKITDYKDRKKSTESNVYPKSYAEKKKAYFVMLVVQLLRRGLLNVQYVEQL